VLVTLVAVALLPMVAQTSLPQVADQFCRAYRQLLVFDHEEYGNDYNYNNLEGSLVAGSVVLYYDGAGSSLGELMGTLCGLAAPGYGYGDGSAKSELLSSVQSWLGSAWNRLKSANAARKRAQAICMGTDTAQDFLTWGTLLASVGGLGMLFGGGHACVAIAAVGLGLLTGVAVVCISVGTWAFWSTLFFGSVSFVVPPTRKRWLRAVRTVEA